MSATNLSRFEELVSRYLDEGLTNTDAAELVASLAEPALAVRFLEMTRFNSEIAGLLSAPVPDAAMVELVRADIEKGLTAAQPSTGVRLRIAERRHSRTVTPSAVSVSRLMTPRRKPALRAWAWAAGFLVFAGLAAVFLFDSTRRAEAPALASVEGEVRVLGPAGERVLKPGESWQRGETLKTVGAKSTATVTFSDGTRLDFAGDSVAVNQSGKEGCRVQLEHGAVRGAVKKQSARRTFVFATPVAEAIVVGTMLQVTTDAHHTRLVVTEGQVLLKRRSDGTEIMVRAGFHVLVGPINKLTADPNVAGKQHR